ncbi:MAG: hypothetical protein Q7T82_20965 [Armatimonadota bacterium]|nr:hypothetical protein [Armatimonadota bacterium]
MTAASTKPWSYAIVQHPMWLLIAEDTICAERTPPWGSPSIEEYIEKLVVSLDSQERFPQLHVNFDFSAVELEDMVRLYPESAKRLRKMAAKGRVSFVNGTYSQPHLQILSVESAIRQFQYGLRSIEQLTGYRVTSYAAQEPGLTPQLPQILRAFGFQTATGPSFPYGVRLFGGLVQHWDNKWEWVHGDDLLNWRAPDGSRIPIWLKASCAPDSRACANEAQHGMLHHTRLRADILDMIEVTPEWVAEIEESAAFVQLDKTLAELIAAEPPRTDAEIDANYAYTEGVDAEELSRANTCAETALLTLEAFEAMIGAAGLPAFDLDAAWKTLLKAQHHDAYWTGGPELRAKSINWLREVKELAHGRITQVAKTLAQGMAAPTPGTEPVVIFAPYPKPCTMPVEIPVPAAMVSVVDEKGRAVPAQVKNGTDGSTSAVIMAASQGMGYSTRFLKTCPAPRPSSATLSDWFEFSNAHYSVSVLPDGTISSLAPRGGQDLLTSGADCVGNMWLYSDGGRDILPLAKSSGNAISGPVFESVETRVQTNTVRLTKRLTFYHELPWFQVDTELEFEEPAEIGDYFDDRTKLHYTWPVGKNVEIRHAVGGCPTSAQPGRTFLVSPWVHVRGERAGMAICLFNAAKCWLDSDGILRFVAAWGHNGDHFHNRQGPLPGVMGPLNWLKPMDLRLRGRHALRYAVWPYGPRITEGQIGDWAASLLLPPIAIPVETGGGREPWSKTVLSVNTPGAVPLSVRQVGDRVVLRMMEMNGQTARLGVDSEEGWTVSELRNLDGKRARSIGPHKIVEVKLER